MAPSYEVGNPQKSLVRIPGSGINKELKPICLEIAQIASFGQSGVIPNIQLPPPEQLPPNRVYRLTYHAFVPRSHPSATTNEISLDGGTVSSKRTLEDKTSKKAKKPCLPKVTENSLTKVEDRTTIIKNLLLGKEKLEEENNELRKKIILFRSLLKNKKKLDEFLSAIDQLVK